MVESERHNKYKELLKCYFHSFEQKPYKYLFEEFSIEKCKFDLVAYPPLESENFKIISMECGNVKSNCHKNLYHFKKVLRFVHQVIWIPYDITVPPFMDLINSLWEDMIFLRLLFITSNSEFEICNNTYTEEPPINKIGGVIITFQGRYPDYDKLYQQQIEGKFGAIAQKF